MLMSLPSVMPLSQRTFQIITSFVSLPNIFKATKYTNPRQVGGFHITRQPADRWDSKCFIGILSRRAQ